MKNIVTVTLPNGTRMYGKFVGTFELVVDTSGSYVPGWVPDCEYFWWDALEGIDGQIYCVEPYDDTLVASKPDDDCVLYREWYGPIDCRNKAQKKRGRHSLSNNRKANRQRIFDAEPLPF